MATAARGTRAGTAPGTRQLSAPAGIEERTVEINGHPCRVWEKGSGPRLGYLSPAPGVPRWQPFLEQLSERRRVVVPSIPGLFGATGHGELDDTADWIAMALDLVEASGLAGQDLIGGSIGGMLAAEVATFSEVSKLVLIAPYGLYDPEEPVSDPFAVPPAQQAPIYSANPAAFLEAFGPPSDPDQAQEFMVLAYRASETAARLVWPFGDRGLRKRLHRITCPTLLLWGSQDRIIPASYAKRFATGITGPTRIRSLEAAGHLAAIDAPEAAAAAVLEFLEA